MKTNKYIFRPPRRGIGIMILMILGCMSLFAQQLQFTKPFDFTIGQNFFIEEKTDENGTFVHLKHNDMDKTGVVGAPELPVEYVRISVPYNAVNIQITATRTVSRTLSLGRYVYPVQESVPIGQEITFTQPDPSIYSQSTLYPNKVAEIVGVGFFDGCNQVVTVALYPTEFSPTNRSLRLSSKITFQLRFNITSPSNMPTPPVIPRWRNPEKIDILKSMVINPESVLPFAPTTPQNKPPQSTAANPIYDYVIVTADSLRPAFDRFVAWKRQKGYNVKVEAIENILSSTTYANGDEVSGINDDAGKLRAYLRQCYINNGTEFVLLAGDYTIMPIRYGYSIDQNQNQGHYISTDLYYSDLTADWDSNNNGIYGEIDDSIDVNAELYVGRLICKNYIEIQNYTEKLIRYELNPGQGNFSYLMKSLYFQNDQMQLSQYSQKSIEAFKNIFNPEYAFVMEEDPSYNHEYPTYPTGVDVINEMNNFYGYVSAHVHGSPTALTTINAYKDKPPRTVIRSQYEYINPNEIRKDECSGLDKLINYDYPFVMYSMSCSPNPFEDCEYEYNIGSAFTVAGKYGGPAFLGNTNWGWIGPSDKLEEFFAQCLLEYKSIGIAEAESKTFFYNNNSEIKHWVSLTHNLIGEPEFEMWTDIPTDFTNISVQRTDNNIVVSGSELTNCYVGVSSDNGSYVQNLGTSAAATFSNVDPNSIVTVYKHNYIPYIPVVLQNATLACDKHIVATTAQLGSAIDPNRTVGDFIVPTDVTLNIQASQNVELHNGFVVQPGGNANIRTDATVYINGMNGDVFISEADEVCITSEFVAYASDNIRIRSNQKVKILGGKLKAGSQLRICAPSVEIIQNFETEKGATIEITN